MLSGSRAIASVTDTTNRTMRIGVGAEYRTNGATLFSATTEVNHRVALSGYWGRNEYNGNVGKYNRSEMRGSYAGVGLEVFEYVKKEKLKDFVALKAGVGLLYMRERADMDLTQIFYGRIYDSYINENSARNVNWNYFAAYYRMTLSFGNRVDLALTPLIVEKSFLARNSLTEEVEQNIDYAPLSGKNLPFAASVGLTFYIIK